MSGWQIVGLVMFGGPLLAFVAWCVRDDWLGVAFALAFTAFIFVGIGLVSGGLRP